MKGIIFTEFLDLVEEKFGEDVLEDMIDSCELESGAAYTSIGTYDHQEILKMVTELSRISGVPAEGLVNAFGRHLVKRFTVVYPRFFEEADGAFDFLRNIENHIHVEVRKLYNETELPTFSWNLVEANFLQLTYRSRRPFALLAQGMIEATFEHYNEKVELTREDLSTAEETVMRFDLRRV